MLDALLTPAKKPSSLDMFYVITPSYVPYSEAVGAAVFISRDKQKTLAIMDLLNNSHNDVTSYIHKLAKDTIDGEPQQPKFRLLKFSPRFFKAKSSPYNNYIYCDFLLLEGLINQTLDKHASSSRNDEQFNSHHLNAFRTISADKHFV